MTARKRRALVPRKVSGRCVVTGDQLQAKLGRTAWALLVRLWARRDDRTGKTFASDMCLARDLAAERGRPRPTKVGGEVKRGLAKLRRSGLLSSPELGRGTYDGEDGAEGLGWQTVVPYGRVFVREVLGLMRPDGGVLVPAEVSMWVKKQTERRGGRRPGAGRKKGSKDQKPRIKTGPNPPVSKNQNRPHKYISNNTSNISSLRSEMGGAARRPDLTPPGSRTREPVLVPGLDFDLPVNPVSGPDSPPGGPAVAVAGPAAAPSGPTPTGTPGGAADALVAILGAVLTGSPTERRPLPVDVPLRMWSWPVRTPRRPLPPKMPADVESPFDIAEFVARTYASAYKAATGKPYRPFIYGHLPRHPSFDSLLGAGRTFHEEGTRPARWVLWSFDVWRDAGRRGAPPPGWVFSTERLTEHWRWFRDEEDGYAVRLTMMGPVERALGKRWLAMRQASVLRGPGVTGDEIAERWFPGDSWERAVSDAQAEAARTQAELDRRVAAGEWLW